MSKLFYIAIVIIAVLLGVIAVTSSERTNAIMASVESQKTAISFQKAVQVKAIYVSAGQRVNKGQLLLEVERPDLALNRTQLNNDRLQEQARKKRLAADHNSKIALLDIEIEGKIQRLNSDIRRLEAEMKYRNELYSNISSLAGTDSSRYSAREEDLLELESLRNEIKALEEYSRSEKARYRILLQEDLEEVDLRLSLLEKEEEALTAEEATLKQYAPFDGTIGNVNAQLRELVPPFETIISLFEVQPTTITAHLNLESGIEMTVGQKVMVESGSRAYSVWGEVVEIGSRIVSYRDTSQPATSPDLYGREVFIKLPEENDFLYGEQVFVFVDP